MDGRTHGIYPLSDGAPYPLEQLPCVKSAKSTNEQRGKVIITGNGIITGTSIITDKSIITGPGPSFTTISIANAEALEMNQG